METLIHIGPKIDAEGLKEFRGAINDILRAKIDQSTMHAALACLERGVRLSGGDHNTLSGCNITANDSKATTRKRPAAKKARRK
jgi:hypothetical protein